MEPPTLLLIAWCFALAVPLTVALLVADRVLWRIEYRREMTARADQSLAIASERGILALLEHPAPTPCEWQPCRNWPFLGDVIEIMGVYERPTR